MAGISPTQRTLKAMKDMNRIAGIVEKFIPPGIRQDLFGFIDIICIDPEQGIVAVQSCGQDFSGHVHKLTEERAEIAYKWLQHAPCELWGWRKVKNRLKSGGYGKGYHYEPRIGDLVIDEHDTVVLVERKQNENR